MKKRSLLFILSLLISATAYTQNLVDLKLLLPGHFKPLTITCEKIDGNYFMQEDILIDVSQIVTTPFIKNATAVKSNSYRWKDGIVPYKIQSGHPYYSDIKAAIAHINQKTNVQLIEQTYQNDYIYIGRKSKNSCYSYVGRIGGEQLVNIGNGCGYGTIIHEICHALGLWHEQSRKDRDNYVTINWNNIQSSNKHNFEKHVDALTFGEYDYNSIMHYGKYAFSKNGQPTITCRNAGCDIGQRQGLSQNDIRALNAMYPRANPKPNPNPKPKPKPNPGKEAVSIRVSDMLSQGIGKGQWKEEVFLKINNEVFRMNLNTPFRMMQTINIDLPEQGTYNYELTVYSYNFECGGLFDCDFDSEPRVGRGKGILKLNSNASFSIYTDNTYNHDNTLNVYLAQD